MVLGADGGPPNPYLRQAAARQRDVVGVRGPTSFHVRARCSPVRLAAAGRAVRPPAPERARSVREELERRQPCGSDEWLDNAGVGWGSSAGPEDFSGERYATKSFLGASCFCFFLSCMPFGYRSPHGSKNLRPRRQIRRPELWRCFLFLGRHPWKRVSQTTHLSISHSHTGFPFGTGLFSPCK